MKFSLFKSSSREPRKKGDLFEICIKPLYYEKKVFNHFGYLCPNRNGFVCSPKEV